MSERLKGEVASLGAIPMDDTAAESPHAAAHRLMRHGPASRWPWVAASMRLEQNLADAESLPASVGVELEDCWRTHTSIMRKPSSKLPDRPLKRQPTKLQQDVYCMSFVHDRAPEMDSACNFENDDPGDPSAGIRPGPRKAPKAYGSAGVGSASAFASASMKWKNRAAKSGQKEVGGATKELLQRRNSDDVRLIRQYFSACLEPGMCVSFPVVFEEGGEADQMFQVLALESRMVLVATYKGNDDDQDVGLFKVTVQPLERWNPASERVSSKQGGFEDAFVLQEPTEVDVLMLCGGATDRSRWLRWTPAQSDVCGCIALCHPKVLQPTMSLSAANVPVLSLLDALDVRGFEGKDQLCVHDGALAKHFDSRAVVSKRCYLQCVLAMEELVNLGVTFPSAQPNSYYALLLRGRKQVPPNLGALEYKARLALEDGDAAELAALEDQQAPAEGPPALVDREQRALADQDGDSSVAGDSDGAPAPQPAVAGEAVAAIDNGSGDEEDDIAGDADGHAGLIPPPAALPDSVCGQTLRKVKGRRGGGWSYHSRVSVVCDNPRHSSCSKSRSVELEASEYGPIGCVYYLGAWLRKSSMPAARHQAYKPSAQEVQAFAQEYASGSA